METSIKQKEVMGMFSKGFVHRWGCRFKNSGDRLGRKRLFGVFVFDCLAVPLRQIGFWLMRKG
jgi:hypothetical protein